MIFEGDSLGASYSPPVKLVSHIQSWLRKEFKGPFTYLGATLPIGRQKDGVSCIMSAVNAVEHGVFDDPLWAPARRTAYRVDWFMTLIQMVRILT